MKLGIDIDLTLVDTGSEWWRWLTDYGNYHRGRNVFKFKEKEEVVKLNYDLTQYFPDFEDKCLNSPFDFWKQEDLYDNLNPLPKSVEVLKQLVEAGHDIVFISHTHGGHFKSKVDWLKKHFPFADIGGKGGFVATKEKYLVNVDIMIDDRIDNLLKFKDSVIKIYFGSIYQDTSFNKQEVDFITNDDCNLGWSELKSYFEELEII